jgi:hypothetical protein
VHTARQSPPFWRRCRPDETGGGVSNPFEKVGQLIDSAKEAEIVTPDFSVSAKDKRQRKQIGKRRDITLAF